MADMSAEMLSTEEGVKKLEKAGKVYLKTHLDEAAVSRSVLPQEPITLDDCQDNLNNDDGSLYVIRYLAPESTGVALDNMGNPNGQFITNRKFAIPMVVLSTVRNSIKRRTLASYRYDVLKVLEDKTGPILDRLEDKMFFANVGAALTVTTAPSVGGEEFHKTVLGRNSGADGLYLHEKDFVELKKTHTGGKGSTEGTHRKKLAKMLMCDETFQTAVSLPGAGDDFGTDRIIHGIQGNTLFGTETIKTIKSDVCPDGHIFAFTAPDFLGYNFSLNEPTFEIHSKFNDIEWQSEETVGMGIGVAEGVALLTLQGAVIPGTVTSIAVSASGKYDAPVAGFYNGLRQMSDSRLI